MAQRRRQTGPRLASSDNHQGNAGVGSTQVGALAEANAPDSTVLGYNATTSGIGSSIALGNAALATGERANAIGTGAHAPLDYQTVIAANNLEVVRADGTTGTTRLILHSPDDTRWAIKVDNAGVLSTVLA